MIEDTLSSLVERFNRHAATHPGVRDEIGSLARTIAIHLTDEGRYAVDLKEGKLQNLRTGDAPHADLTITTDRVTFLGLVSKEIGPMKALVTRRLKIDGSLEDKLLFRRLL